MDRTGYRQTIRVEKGRWHSSERATVQEFPLQLTVNGRELATLVASPHRLTFLVAGFLRLQGFVKTPSDLRSLGICADDGIARAWIRGEVPEALRPTLTSGCGTGITFDLPTDQERPPSRTRFPIEAVSGLMMELTDRAERYRLHGGIHSAAVGDGRNLLLHAEDLGRHNTLDRIAGEALLRGISLEGHMLATSGRISSEMVAKAIRLGITLIASRTSPTEMAVRMAEEAGITLAGYVRRDSLEIFSHPERLESAHMAEKIPGVTGVILAGGKSLRMGSNKALLPHRGGRFIETVYRQLAEIFAQVMVVTNEPELFPFLPCRKVPDIFPGMGALAGIHAGLHHSPTSRIFAVACDMPSLHTALIGPLAAQAPGADVVIPESPHGLEPLHALYHRSCLPAIEEALRSGDGKITSFFKQVQVRTMPVAEVAGHDPEFSSFGNINTPQEYFRLRSEEIEIQGKAAPARGKA